MSGTNPVGKATSNALLCAEPYLEEDFEIHDDDPVIVASNGFDGTDVFPEPLDEDYDEDGSAYARMSKRLMAAGITAQDYAAAEPYLNADAAKSPVERLFGSAFELYGKFWQRPLSRDLKPFQGPSQGHLQQVYASNRSLTVKVEQEVVDALLRERARAKVRLDRATAGIINILIGKEE